jgi:hypothetical protein
MKIVPKFQWVLRFHGKYPVPPSYDILVGLRLLSVWIKLRL